MLKCSKHDCLSYRIIVDSLENVPKYREPEDHENWIIPIHTKYCLSCYANILYNWFSNNNRICISSDYQDPLLYAYKFKNFTKYWQSHKCHYCKITVDGTEKLVGCLEYEEIFKYQNTYHVECFVREFIIFYPIINKSLSELFSMNNI